MPKSYEWLLFDADGTLFDYDRSEGIALQKALADVGIASLPPHLPLYRDINYQLWAKLPRHSSVCAASSCCWRRLPPRQRQRR